jgi:hypothetical protein
METPKGALIAYATNPGKTVSDGTGRYSPFTIQLLREIVIAGRDITATRREHAIEPASLQHMHGRWQRYLLVELTCQNLQGLG